MRRLTQSPEVALPLAASLPGDFDEALVEAEVVPDGVLPALLVPLVEGEPRRDVLVDLREGGPLVGGVLDGHRDEGDVRVGRLRARRRALVRTRASAFAATSDNKHKKAKG